MASTDDRFDLERTSFILSRAHAWAKEKGLTEEVSWVRWARIYLETEEGRARVAAWADEEDVTGGG